MKAERRLSKAPLAEAFADWRNCRLVLGALFGSVMGQAVTYYTSTFYALFFLERIAHVDATTVTLLVGCALAFGIPLVLAAGWLGDRIGRKPVLLAGLGLAALLYFPLFGALLDAANPALAQARLDAPVVVRAAPGGCSLQFDPVGRKRFHSTACDVVKSLLAREGVSHSMESHAVPGAAELVIGEHVLAAPDAAALSGPGGAEAVARFEAEAKAALAAAGYRAEADPAQTSPVRIVAILVGLLAIGALCNGAYGVMLVELFAARFRYSAVSVAQNVGNGWFGGLLPAIAFTIVAATGDIFAGLWYPVAIAAISFLVALFALPETRGRPID
jgi:MFS family permease